MFSVQWFHDGTWPWQSFTVASLGWSGKTSAGCLWSSFLCFFSHVLPLIKLASYFLKLGIMERNGEKSFGRSWNPTGGRETNETFPNLRFARQNLQWRQRSRVESRLSTPLQCPQGIIADGKSRGSGEPAADPKLAIERILFMMYIWANRRCNTVNGLYKMILIFGWSDFCELIFGLKTGATSGLF